MSSTERGRERGWKVYQVSERLGGFVVAGGFISHRPGNILGVVEFGLVGPVDLGSPGGCSLHVADEVVVAVVSECRGTGQLKKRGRGIDVQEHSITLQESRE